MNIELKEQKFRPKTNQKLHGEQNFSPRNKSWLEKVETKIVSAKQIMTTELKEQKIRT
jgi:hypothetical protein